MLPALCAGMMVLVGCTREPEPEFVLSTMTLQLGEEGQAMVQKVLHEQCGTPTRPKLLGDESAEARSLQYGAKVFMDRCAACHGASGDGDGPQADSMYPRPRDYRPGKFKFTSTPYGAKPLRSDLIRTIKHGARGTSMPKFDLLPEADLEALVDHVLALTYRGELEVLLDLEVESEDEIAEDRVPELIDDVLRLWKKAESQIVYPVSVETEFNQESVERGKEAFLSDRGECFKCHGKDGRGMVMAGQQAFKDAWGFQTRAADLTSGMLHGGNRSEDIYRRIYSGINGTPMPSFKSKFESEPELIWDLVHYVQFLSNVRRKEMLQEQDQWMAKYRAAKAGAKKSAATSPTEEGQTP